MSNELQEKAKNLIETLKKKKGLITNTSIADLICEGDKKKIKNFCNDISKLNQHNDISSAKKIIKIIDYYNQDKNNISLNEVYCFLDNSIGSKTAMLGDNIEGWYLLFRRSYIDKKILITYLYIEFKEDCMFFKTERNNFGNDQNLIDIHVKTEGIGVKNISNTYSFIGLSLSSETSYEKSFMETFTLYKEKHNTNPISGYWSGFISLGNTNNHPFVGKVILTKISNSTSIHKIEKETEKYDDFEFYNEHKILKLHNEDELKNDSNLIKKILEKENIKTYKIDYILSNLKMDMDENNKNNEIFYLHKFHKKSNQVD